ncbi:DNA helicase [Actinomyces sp. 565]|uniref:DNA helicase n=1 Tax=Actinomyces sp. 565 TaxID=2057794 RepID=UPI0013A6D800|nr:DNA helicase [Actinomyces sp. 565]NDR54371.1 DNA helicase [Actinomyces sp. 565]
MTPSLFSLGRNRRDAGARARDSEGADRPDPPTTVAPEQPDDTPPEDSDRRARIDEALAAWRQELADLGGTSSLDAFSERDGIVDLTAAHPSGLAQLYAGRPTHLGSLVRERVALGVARQSLRELAGRTDQLSRRFGVAPVYLAIGVAGWTEPVSAANDADVPADPDSLGGSSADPSVDAATVAGPPAAVRSVRAPVLLRPVRLSSAGADASLTLDRSIEVNPVLTRALRRHGCAADVNVVARATLADDGFTPRDALSSIGALGREYLPGFEIHERLVVGAFVHPGQALVEDFDATIDRARTSALVAAVAGDAAARAALDVTLPQPDPSDRAPERERGVGDLDPAQLDAVEAVGTGASLLLDAPPGSDVAATLAAVMADAAALGRTVLHVPATSADGHAVADALRELGLGAIVLDLTEDPAWRRHAAEGIKAAMGVNVPDLDVTAIVGMRSRLSSVRDKLSRYVTALHTPREPWGASAYDALQQLAELTSGRVRARTSARVVAGRLERLDAPGRERAAELLHRAHALGLFTSSLADSAWNGMVVDDVDDATDALARLTRLADELLPAVREQVVAAADSTGITRAITLAQWCEQLEMLDGVRDSLDVFLPEVFERSAADMVIATASKQWRQEHRVEMGRSTRRRFTKQAKDLVRPGREVADLHGELVKVQQRREVWRRYDPDGGWPHLPQGLDEMQRVAARAREAVSALQPVIGADNSLMDLPLVDLEERSRVLAADDVTVHKLPDINRVTTALDDLGLIPLLDDLASRQVEPEQIDDELAYCWWSSLLAQVMREDPDLGGLDADALNDLAVSLRELDAAQADSLAGPVAQACARRVREAVDADKDAARSLYRALSLEEGMSLRDVIASHPIAMVAKPVWIIPPTLVPQVFAADAVVDLAILDASTNVPVSQVIPAFVRAEQVLVVGDPRRAASGLAAELGPHLPQVTLPTGRNTLDAEIAAFLAANGYDDVVEAIPAPPGRSRLSLELVEGRGMPAPGRTAVESVPAEVSRVVDLVIDHALTRPEQSLGVIALNARHAEEIRRATAAAVVGSPALADYFETGVSEPFVVVDLGEARSLRRDQIIVSVGYAKTPHGRTIHSFGAVSDIGGMVGLVEALCASRGGTQIVSCLGPDDIDAGRLHAPGARLLREVLVHAADSGRQYPQQEEVAPERLLVELAEHLWRKGLVVVPRYGIEGGVRIPLAIGHPDLPGELLVAVLTDDVDYVAQPSLRRRDRHWIERLQQRGWHVHTAYSAGVFVDVETEAKKIEAQVLAVLASRTEPVRGAPPLPERPGEDDPLVESASTDPGTAADAAPRGDSPEPPRRGDRPPIAQGLPLQAYSDDQLDELVAWIRSDGVERTAAEETEELRQALALSRRGSGIDAVLANAVRRTR